MPAAPGRTKPSIPRSVVAMPVDATNRLGTDWVLERLESLTPDQRDVLLLRVAAQLTIEDVAAAVGKPAGAVKALQRRELRTLQRQLASKGVPL